MLVASVGVILFPLSIWEGSKPWAEKYIGAVIGFFLKLLFCNLAVMLLLYGVVSMLNIFSSTGFQGGVDQIIFIVFTCLLFFFICKSAPGIAQGLLSGSPSLSASGAISAVGGAVAAAGATMGLAKSVGGLAAKAGGAVAGGAAKGLFNTAGSLIEANAASNAAKVAGGNKAQQAGAFFSSLRNDAGDSIKAGAYGLTRSLLGGNNGSGGSGGGVNPHSWRQDFNRPSERIGHEGEQQTYSEHFERRKSEGAERGQKYFDSHKNPDQKAASS